METKEFAEAFLGPLTTDDFHESGSLLAYLALPAGVRSGDEANIVDSRITRALIQALGYAPAEADYNQGKDNLRPDFVVRIRGYPGCCFVVEDKATVERQLEGHRPQLARYMAAHRSPRGLLVNGQRLIGYDDGVATNAATLDLSLETLVRLWRGEDLLAAGARGWEALPPADRDALAVLLRRYGRMVFQGVQRLIDDLTLDNTGKPHATDGTTWKHGLARIKIVDARDAPDALVAAIQALIGDLREDVAVQFAAREREHDAFLAETARAPGSSALAAELMEDIAERCLVLLPGTAKDRRDALRSRLRLALRGESGASEIDAVIAEVRLAARGGNGNGPDALARAGAEARSFAARYGRHLAQARARHAASVATMEAFERWRAAVGTLLLSGASAERARQEYFAQTAYVVVVRMLLVRVLEDKKLTPRVFTNGGVALWFRQVEPHYFSLATGRSAARLLEIAYENAQATYAHFYDDQRVFDWYAPDRNTLLRVLHRLAGFDLVAMDRDIIGTVYGRFVNERHKHEQGMYYTPREVVGFILDRIGWSGPSIVGARLLDPACGSGAFLVEAARRAVEAHRAQARADGYTEIPPERVQDVLDSLRDGLVGFDLNPFACALAEINLLVQLLDLIAHAYGAGHPVHLDRFRIYTTDALRLSPAAAAAIEFEADKTAATDLPDEEQAKGGLGIYADGFDAVVGNPPYVRADEGAEGLKAYRQAVMQHPVPGVRAVLAQKWDLFVPFVSLGLHLLKRPGGRLGMIVSNAIETVLYAKGLREKLAREATLQEVHFFEPRVKLFEDAAVRNTILVAAAEPPTPASETLREWHGDKPPAALRRQRLPQMAYDTEVFRPALPSLRVPKGGRAFALKHVCYVSVGMVLSAHEKLEKGRHKGSFAIDDLLQATPDSTHSKPYVGSEDLRIPHATCGDFLFAAAHIQYLEYGTARVPGLIRRKTFPELYDRAKVMVGKFGGAVHDDGTLDPRGFLNCNHTVFLFLPWHSLVGVKNRSVVDRVQELETDRQVLEKQSMHYPLAFLSGLFNSATWGDILAGRVTEAVGGGSQPNDFSDQEVPVPDPAFAAEIGRIATAAREEGRALGALSAAGWDRHRDGWRAPATQAAAMQQAAFGVARTRWGLTIQRPTARCDRLRRDGDRLIAGQREAATLAAGTPPEAADFLLRVLRSRGAESLQSVEAAGLQIPLRPDDAAQAERSLLAAEREALAREARIVAHRAAIDGLLAPLFEAVPHPPIETVSPLA